MSRYLVIIEESATGFSAFLPDLPGCIATGTTRDEVENAMRKIYVQTKIDFNVYVSEITTEGVRITE